MPVISRRTALLKALGPGDDTPRIVGEQNPNLQAVVEQIGTVPEAQTVLQRVPAIASYRTSEGIRDLLKQLLNVGPSAALPTPVGGVIGMDVLEGDYANKEDFLNPDRVQQRELRDTLLHEIGHIRQGLGGLPLRNDQAADYFVKKYKGLLDNRYPTWEPSITGRDITLPSR